MARYVDVEAHISDLTKMNSEFLYADGDERYLFAYGVLTGIRKAITYAEHTPTADVAEVKHGYWLYNRGQAPNEKAYFCSLCIDGDSDYGMDNYCPNCGAKMDDERKEQ